MKFRQRLALALAVCGLAAFAALVAPAASAAPQPDQAPLYITVRNSEYSKLNIKAFAVGQNPSTQGTLLRPDWSGTFTNTNGELRIQVDSRAESWKGGVAGSGWHAPDCTDLTPGRSVIYDPPNTANGGVWFAEVLTRNNCLR